MTGAGEGLFGDLGGAERPPNLRMRGRSPRKPSPGRGTGTPSPLIYLQTISTKEPPRGKQESLKRIPPYTQVEGNKNGASSGEGFFNDMLNFGGFGQMVLDGFSWTLCF